MYSWYYHGFTRRFNLSYVKVSGASRKLPVGWESKVHNINVRVGRTQIDCHNENNVLIPAIPDMRWANSDHVPIYCEPAGNHTWGVRNTSGRQVGTGGAEKERFTCQLTVSKNGHKLPPFMIFKGASIQKKYNQGRILLLMNCCIFCLIMQVIAIHQVIKLF